MRRDSQRRPWLRLVLATLGIACSSALWALPEDAKLPINFDAGSFSGTLDDGLSTLKGTAKVPARISQGSLIITGAEIRISSKGGEVQTVTATGNPARFEQQPAKDKAVIHGSGKQIKLDNKTRLLSLDSGVELNQNNIVSTGSHIDYNLDTRRLDGTDVHMIVPPKKDTP